MKTYKKIYKCDFLTSRILESDQETIENIVQNKSQLYSTFTIPKKRGTRLIHALKEEDGKQLSEMQKKLYEKFLRTIPIAIPAKGFVKGENYLSFLQPHVGNDYFMRIDIKDFFGSFSEKMIRDALSEYVEDDDALDVIWGLCNVEGKLPQGAITSPVISNIAFRRIDQRILKYCQSVEERYRKEYGSLHIYYTRYADDMLFSSDFFDFKNYVHFYRMVVKILKDNCFQVNREKNVIANKPFSINGYVLDNTLHLSRNKVKNLKKILYYFRDKNSSEYKLDGKKFSVLDKNVILAEINKLDLKTQYGKKEFKNINQLANYLSGCRSWIISILQVCDSVSQEFKNMQKLVRRVEKLLDRLKELEE